MYSRYSEESKLRSDIYLLHLLNNDMDFLRKIEQECTVYPRKFRGDKKEQLLEYRAFFNSKIGLFHPLLLNEPSSLKYRVLVLGEPTQKEFMGSDTPITKDHLVKVFEKQFRLPSMFLKENMHLTRTSYLIPYTEPGMEDERFSLNLSTDFVSGSLRSQFHLILGRQMMCCCFSGVPCGISRSLSVSPTRCFAKALRRIGKLLVPGGMAYLHGITTLNDSEDPREAHRNLIFWHHLKKEPELQENYIGHKSRMEIGLSSIEPHSTKEIVCLKISVVSGLLQYPDQGERTEPIFYGVIIERPLN